VGKAHTFVIGEAKIERAYKTELFRKEMFSLLLHHGDDQA